MYMIIMTPKTRTGCVNAGRMRTSPSTRSRSAPLPQEEIHAQCSERAPRRPSASPINPAYIAYE